MVGRPPSFIGFRNYQAAFTDPLVGKSLWNTAYYTLFHVPGSTVIAFAVAGPAQSEGQWACRFGEPCTTSRQ